MSRSLFGLWRGEMANALLLIPIAMVGFALPLGFVSQVDGYLKYLRPIELPVVYAWGWIVFGFVGLAITLATIVPVMGAARLLRRSPAVWAGRVGAWLSLSIMAVSLLIATKLWFEVNGFAFFRGIGEIREKVAFAVAMVCAVWIWRRHALPRGLHGLTVIGATAGLVAMVVAASIAWFSLDSPHVPFTAVEASGQAIKRPNIILLTIDTLAADHMSLYGYGRETTPNLDRLVRQASVFDRFYANCNFTTPAVSSIILGLRPWSHRTLQLHAQIDAAMADRSLMARLKKAGYQPLAVATNDFAAPSRIGVSRWLDKVAEGRTNTLLPWGGIFKILPSRATLSLELGILPHVFKGIEFFALSLNKFLRLYGFDADNDYNDPELAFSTTRDFVLHRDSNKPFFLWVHLFPPHNPYAAPRPFIGRFDPRPEARTYFDSSPPVYFEARGDVNFPDRYMGRYDESILYVDYHLGRFIEWLRNQALFDESLLVISADHGESFVHGYGLHGGPMLYEALIRVPLVLKEPAQRVGMRLDVLAEQVDLMPTILDLVGIADDGAGEGRSLKPAIQGEKLAGAVFSMNFEQSTRYDELHKGSVAMIEGHWKYVHYRGRTNYPMQPILEDSLYDLKTDPGEKANLIRANPATAAQMLTKIQAQLHLHGRPVK